MGTRTAAGIVAGLLLAAGAAHATPGLAGHWQGTMVEQGQSLPVSFDFDPDQAHGRFTSPVQRAMDYPLDAVARDQAHVTFTVGGGIHFDGALSDREIAGTFKTGGASGTFTLHRGPAPVLPYDVVPVSFRNGAVVLKGTLCLPHTPGRHGAVVLVHGSGPETRWGTNRYIADRMARAGVAALIFDKRGSGESGGDWRTSRYEDLARDALAGVDLLDARPDIDPRRVGIHGHSQGGVIGPLAATLAPGKIAFIVAMDTFAGPQRDQDIYRVDHAIDELRLSAADKAKAMQVYTLFVDAASGAVPYETFEAAAAPYKGAAWYGWMDFPPRDSWVWTFGRLNGAFDTLPVWRKVRQPVLLIYGEKDILQPLDATIATITGALDASHTPYTALIAPGAVHNLTIQPDEKGPFFWWKQAPGLVEVVVDWVSRQAGVRSDR
ncbi:alpha/beta hydrolase family protein [Phenylobacterium sp.]|uniref:alpha/beta hydrolase family protein n=1 Tax=Phenylobacterium sp. TaxID=1871053 RepID=UPI002F4192C7